jgi:transcription initiation factor TFIID subunit 1
LIADKITVSMGKFNREESDMTLRRIAKLIESEVLSTPWNLSSSFIKEKKEGNMMLIDGVGDPSYGHGGYSYIKMPLKTSGDSL